MDIKYLKENIEEIAKEVHNAWWKEKERQGFHPPIECNHGPHGRIPIIGEEEARDAAFTKHCDWCHTDMYEYECLPEHVKEYDRVTAKAVLDAVEKVIVDWEDTASLKPKSTGTRKARVVEKKKIKP